MWNNLHSIISSKSGDFQDHVLLLESLLLGFGLKAYICNGLSFYKGKTREYMWVMTISTDGSIIFYDAVNGKKYKHEYTEKQSMKVSYPFTNIGSIFNDKEFYANIQVYDDVKMVKFEINNPQYWYPLDTNQIQALKHVNCIYYIFIFIYSCSNWYSSIEYNRRSNIDRK